MIISELYQKAKKGVKAVALVGLTALAMAGCQHEQIKRAKFIHDYLILG